MVGRRLRNGARALGGLHDELVMIPQPGYCGIMKTTVDIPDKELADAIRFTDARTKREAIVGAIVYFNQRMRMAELTKHAGSCPDLVTPEEIRAIRRRG